MSYTLILQLSEKPISIEKHYTTEQFYEFVDVNCRFDFIESAESDEAALHAFTTGRNIRYVPKARIMKYFDGYTEKCREEYLDNLKKEVAKVTVESLKGGIPWSLKESVCPYDEPIIILDGTFVTYTDWKLAWVEPDKPYYIGAVAFGRW